MSGHLLEPNMIIPFSMERLSLGRLAAFHILVSTGSSRSCFMEISGKRIIPFS